MTTPTRKDTKAPAEASTLSDIDAFLQKVKDLGPATTAAGNRGRLIFALDATMSRQPTWDTACALQADMFREAAATGGLDIQLVYFRGLSECRASGWVAGSDKLAALMQRIDCRGGHTQIGKVLSHARKEQAQKPVQALVFVGDAMEEGIDDLAHKAGELGLLKVPVFMFQEGRDPSAETGFREIARLTRGAYFRFGSDAARILGELLAAVAVYAAGGFAALENHSAQRGGAASLLLQQMK